MTLIITKDDTLINERWSVTAEQMIAGTYSTAARLICDQQIREADIFLHVGMAARYLAIAMGMPKEWSIALARTDRGDWSWLVLAVTNTAYRMAGIPSHPEILRLIRVASREVELAYLKGTS